SHAGQVSFPGGRIEPRDESPLAAALREAEEEVGLAPHLVTPLGVLGLLETGTGYLIHPVVGVVTGAFTLSLDPGEVADAFEVPLAFLMDQANHELRSGVWKGQTRHYYAMPYGERFIWGATAAILRELSDRLGAEGLRPWPAVEGTP
ncbi:MAG: CoA pyrophosphatase, partial [Alphaproteobacteria bacterium]|nr:CoA pyrophosphatase [Alphaproteobacteria bacterium]